MAEFFDNPKTLLEQTDLVQRFIEYTKIETTSDENSTSCPSTPGQSVLAQKAVEDLISVGVLDAKVDENGYVLASIASNTQSELTVGLIAHLDTSSAAPGANVQPRLHPDYNGNDLQLNDGIVLEADASLKECLGDTIITSGGTTLLGADDKAGMAVIVSAAEFWMKNPDVPHPAIRIAFTPDEEIGRGADRFPYREFGADFAYTLDGSFIGEINIETFEAYAAEIIVEGVATHPGFAKGKLVNALKYIGEIICRLPAELSPENTSDRQGFLHPVSCNGDSSKCSLHFIIRDFDLSKVEELKQKLENIVNEVAAIEPRLKTQIKFSHTYPNMFPYFEGKDNIWKKAEEAVRKAGIIPVIIPIRGGTDGATLTRNGLLCPNLFAGGMNIHDKREWVSDRVMGLSLCTVLNLMILHTK